MIPNNLRREIESLQKAPKGHIILPWNHKKLEFDKKYYKKGIVENLGKEDIDYIQDQLEKKCKLWNPDMKKLFQCLKLSAWMMLILTIILITILILFVVPGDLELLSFLIFGLSSTLMIFVILGILGCVLMKADEDYMVNREMELRENCEQMNIDHFFSRNIVFRIGKLGCCLIVRNAKLISEDCEVEDLPTLANVYDDESLVYYEAKSSQPFCGPASKFDPLKRRYNGYYQFLKRNK